MRTLVVFYRRRSLSPAAHLDGGRARTACAVAATRHARMLLTTDARCVVRTGGCSYSPESDLRVGIHSPTCSAPSGRTAWTTDGHSWPQVFFMPTLLDGVGCIVSWCTSSSLALVGRLPGCRYELLRVKKKGRLIRIEAMTAVSRGTRF